MTFRSTHTRSTLTVCVYLANRLQGASCSNSSVTTHYRGRTVNKSPHLLAFLYSKPSNLCHQERVKQKKTRCTNIWWALLFVARAPKDARTLCSSNLTSISRVVLQSLLGGVSEWHGKHAALNLKCSLTAANKKLIEQSACLVSMTLRLFAAGFLRHICLRHCPCHW